MQNSNLKYDYVKRILIYLIIGISAFQFPLIFTNNATGFEAKFINIITESPFTKEIIDYISPFITKFSISLVILFRAIGAIFIAVSVAIFYKTILNKEDVACLTIATLLFLFNPLTQIIFLLTIPFSVTLFAITSIFKVYIDREKGYKLKIGILLILAIIIASWTSVIDINYLYVNIALILIPLIAYCVGVKLYKSTKVLAYVIVIIFIATSAIVKVAPKLSIGKDILYDDRDMKGIASFLLKNMSDERYLYVNNIYDGELIKYYIISDIKVEKFDSSNIQLPAVILSEKELNLSELSVGADAKNVGIYSAIGKNRSMKYYIYSIK